MLSIIHNVSYSFYPSDEDKFTYVAYYSAYHKGRKLLGDRYFYCDNEWVALAVVNEWNRGAVITRNLSGHDYHYVLDMMERM